jgi:chitinase
MSTPVSTSASAPKNTPRRRLSVLRLLVAVVATVAVIGGVGFGYQWWLSNSASASAKGGWFAGYVDVTATPSFRFEAPTAKSGKDVVLSFIVSDPGAACEPSWGGAYSLDEASATLDLDRRVARFEQLGGDVAVSFGGQRNDELAKNCTNVADLAMAYTSVIDRYNITTVDLDLEGDNLADTAAAARRAAAVAQVQRAQRAAGKDLAVWLTLPVSPAGLAVDGQNAVRAALEKHVDLAGVNAMTMDYGSSRKTGQSMLDATTSALTQTQRQLGILYRQAGTPLSDQTLWSKIGATPMIGQNDTKDEIFSLAAAKSLSYFVSQHKIGRVSMWSLNRDRTCGSNYVDLKVVSDSCSGVAQGKVRFADDLSAGLTGRPSTAAGLVTTKEPVDAKAIKDDPAKSPYQIWAQNGSYLQGTKVVWHHNVYAAKWWTRGDLPDNPVLNSWETPWTLVGPVLPGETPIKVPTLPAGTYPDWTGTGIYDKGFRVLFDGVPFEAKWWNQAQSPDAASSDPDGSPWVPLTAVQIKEIAGR